MKPGAVAFAIQVNKRSNPMAKYILLVNWTDQGIRNVKDSAKRLDAGRALAKEQGCVLESFFMTMGSFDNVAVVEANHCQVRANPVLRGQFAHRYA